MRRTISVLNSGLCRRIFLFSSDIDFTFPFNEKCPYLQCLRKGGHIIHVPLCGPGELPFA